MTALICDNCMLLASNVLSCCWCAIETGWVWWLEGLFSFGCVVCCCIVGWMVWLCWFVGLVRDVIVVVVDLLGLEVCVGVRGMLFWM